MFMFTWKKLRNKRPTPGKQRQALRDTAHELKKKSKPQSLNREQARRDLDLPRMQK